MMLINEKPFARTECYSLGSCSKAKKTETNVAKHINPCHPLYTHKTGRVARSGEKSDSRQQTI